MRKPLLEDRAAQSVRVGHVDRVVACVDVPVPAVEGEGVVEWVALCPAAAVGVVVAGADLVQLRGVAVVPVAGEAVVEARVALRQRADELPVGLVDGDVVGDEVA
jgi:hypothetical protein